MGLDRLRRYDIQAGYACWLAVASIAPFLASLWQIYGRYHPLLGRIIYGSKGSFVLAFIGSTAATFGLSGLAFLLGWNSAGQRRNDHSGQSWLGFFLGGTILTFDLVLIVAFYLLRLEKPM